MTTRWRHEASGAAAISARTARARRMVGSSVGVLFSAVRPCRRSVPAKAPSVAPDVLGEQAQAAGAVAKLPRLLEAGLELLRLRLDPLLGLLELAAGERPDFADDGLDVDRRRRGRHRLGRVAAPLLVAADAAFELLRVAGLGRRPVPVGVPLGLLVPGAGPEEQVEPALPVRRGGGVAHGQEAVRSRDGVATAELSVVRQQLLHAADLERVAGDGDADPPVGLV